MGLPCNINFLISSNSGVCPIFLDFTHLEKVKNALFGYTDSSDRLVRLVNAYCTEDTTAYEKIVFTLIGCDWIENG